MKPTRVSSLMMLIVGALLLLGGIGGFVSLYSVSQEYERTTAVVQDFQIERVYRYRKHRYESRMQISYPTLHHGEQRVTCDSYWPFRSKGDELTVWYHPDRPWEFRLPGSESLLWGVFAVSGLLVAYVGLVVRKNAGKAK